MTLLADPNPWLLFGLLLANLALWSLPERVTVPDEAERQAMADVKTQKE